MKQLVSVSHRGVQIYVTVPHRIILPSRTILDSIKCIAFGKPLLGV